METFVKRTHPLAYHLPELSWCYTSWGAATCQWETRPALSDGQTSHHLNKMCGKWKIVSSFLSDVLVHLHQGLLLSWPKLDANQTAVVPDIVKCSALQTTSVEMQQWVYDNQTRYCCIRPFWNLKYVNMVIYKSKSLNLNLNLTVFSINQAIECLL